MPDPIEDNGNGTITLFVESENSRFIVSALQAHILLGLIRLGPAYRYTIRRREVINLVARYYQLDRDEPVPAAVRSSLSRSLARLSAANLIYCKDSDVRLTGRGEAAGDVLWRRERQLAWLLKKR